MTILCVVVGTAFFLRADWVCRRLELDEAKLKAARAPEGTHPLSASHNAEVHHA
jgi:hypothetical protein